MAYNYLFIPNFSSSESNTFKLQAAYDMLNLEIDWEEVAESFDFEDIGEVEDDIAYDILSNISSTKTTLSVDSKDDTLNSTYLEYVSQYLDEIKHDKVSVTFGNQTRKY